MNGVGEVYIYCGAHTEQVEDYISSSRWSDESPTSPFSVLQFVRVADARSAGDVLRDMDKRALVDGDFLLVHGDLVSNISLGDALVAHRKRKEASAANIMTVVLTSGGNNEHRTKTNGITPIFAIDTKNQRCLHYDEMNPVQEDHYLTLDPAIPDELSTSFELRADLIDPQIDICTAEVLALWSESFDYELPRRNFLHGVLKDWELNGKMIYTDVIENGYAARASNLQMYDAISKDVMSRWTFPFIPENNLTPKSTYKRQGHGVVAESGANQDKDAKVNNSILGRNSTIGPGSTVKNSIIGQGCKIGSGVVIDSSYIWSDVVIEDGANISTSILADASVVGKNCSVPPGTLLSYGVHISDGITLNVAASLSTVTDDGKPATQNTSLLGPDTNAATYHDPELDDLDEEDPSHLQRSLIYSHAHLSLSTMSISTMNTEVPSDDDEDFSTDPSSAARLRLDSFASEDSATQISFHADAVFGLLDALRAETGDFDSAKLEFMGLRLANNASDQMMRKAVATAFSRRAAELITPEYGSLEPAKAAQKVFTARPGASKFVDEVGVGGEEKEQVEFILASQRALQHVSKAGGDVAKIGTLLAAMLQQLYILDILEEDGILGWWGDERAVEKEGMAALRDRCKTLVDWLENASEEEEDSDDDDDEEETSDDE